MSWAVRGQVVLWGQFGLYRVLGGVTSSEGWRYRLQQLDPPHAVHAGISALECRTLPVQPSLPPLPAERRRKAKGRP